MPICEICGKEFIQNKHYGGNRVQRYCSEDCRKKGLAKYLRNYMNNYWKKYPNKYLENKMKQYARKEKERMIVLLHYGGNPPKCACCGETHIEFLTIDHISGGGRKGQAKKIKRGGEYHRIIKENFPDDIQVLCLNCNWAKRFYKNKRFCPVHHPELYK